MKLGKQQLENSELNLIVFNSWIKKLFVPEWEWMFLLLWLKQVDSLLWKKVELNHWTTLFVLLFFTLKIMTLKYERDHIDVNGQ